MITANLKNKTEDHDLCVFNDHRNSRAGNKREEKKDRAELRKRRDTEGNNGEVERQGKNLSKCLQPLNRLIAREGSGKSVDR